jgi:hypothetical protein
MSDPVTVSLPTVYVNEDGDLWVAVEDVASFREARSAAMQMAVEQWSQRAVYVGKMTVPLTDHEYGCRCEPSCYRDRLAYHFEGRET